MLHLLLLLTIIYSFSWSSSFSISSGYIQRHHSTVASSKATLLHSTDDCDDDKQAEIAALEERLKQLRDQEASPQRFFAKETESVPLELHADERDGMEAETADSIMFSERWKEAKDNYVIKQEESRVGGIVNVGLALGLIVLIGIFSQVPIGEESLQKYQAVQGNPSRIDLGDLNPVQ